jgi:hypothetical protein
MTSINKLQQNYIDRALLDLNLGQLPEQEQAKALNMLSERFNRVVVVALLKVLSPEQKQRFSEVLENPESLDYAVSEIAAEVPGLNEILEQALMTEYQDLKQNMGE